MKIFWTISLLSTLAFSKEYHCSKHSFYLLQTEYGYEHVSHKIFLNSSILISEFSDNNCFIENVSCTNKGFKIIGSHRQYGDLTKKTFLLTPINRTTYKFRRN